jgi:Spy/CpxP family protein refolding chaperone
MNPILYKVLLSAGVQALKYLTKRYSSLTPEQKAELKAASESRWYEQKLEP